MMHFKSIFKGFRRNQSHKRDLESFSSVTGWFGTQLLFAWIHTSSDRELIPSWDWIHFAVGWFSSIQSLSRVQFFVTPVCSMPGFLVHHQLPELAQTHVHWVGDAIQPSHLLSSPSPPAVNLPQHQGLFQWVSSSSPHVAKVLELPLQHQSFQWILRTEFLYDWLV